MSRPASSTVPERPIRPMTALIVDVLPLLGQTLLIFAFIVTVIGGLGSLVGAAVAAVTVALLQQFANYYLGGTGDFAGVILLAVVLLTRPSGLLGRKVI